jgi:hypothetical protein
VAALLDDAPRSQWLPAVATGFLLVLTAVSAAEASRDLEALFDPGNHTSISLLTPDRHNTYYTS